jgi:hypothetical protein
MQKKQKHRLKKIKCKFLKNNAKSILEEKRGNILQKNLCKKNKSTALKNKTQVFKKTRKSHFAKRNKAVF